MFRSARLKLTAWYLLIIMLISVAFSVGIYQVLVVEVTRFERLQRIRIEEDLENENLLPPNVRFKTDQPVINTDPELIQEIEHRVALALSLINIGIFFIAGGLGYFLSGKTLRPIKEMVDNQNQFISDASHELKTPLTALKSSMEVNLRDKNLSLKEAKTLIKESISEVNKLQALSEGLLSLVGYQKPNGNFKLTSVSTLKVLNLAVKKMKHLAGLKNITIKNTTKNYKIKGNEDSLVDLFVILLDNAIKYSPKKSKVEIKCTKNNDAITISVKDYGIGIAEENKLYIFDRFYRVDKSRSKKGTDGYGLGLSIAKKIIQNHHGTIKAESEHKKGTTLIVTLPIK